MSAPATRLSVEGLTTQFFTKRGVIGAVESVSFHVDEGEAVGIVGESGSGKSVTALSILRLVPSPGKIVGGRIKLGDTDLLTLSEIEMRHVRRKSVAMIFQDPSNFLNPIMTIGQQIEEAIERRGKNRDDIAASVIEALQSVHIPDADRVASNYPFQMSGGMQQRAVIASALVRNPSLIIADEPTTALDATVQFQILRLLVDLQASTGAGLILISHDLAVISSVCARVYVMYAAQVIESGPTEAIYRRAAHPYTKALLGAILDPLQEKKQLVVLSGAMPDLVAPPSGCRFHPRCPSRLDKCATAEPPLFEVTPQHTAKCWLHETQARVVQ